MSQSTRQLGPCEYATWLQRQLLPYVRMGPGQFVPVIAPFGRRPSKSDCLDVLELLLRRHPILTTTYSWPRGEEPIAHIGGFDARDAYWDSAGLPEDLDLTKGPLTLVGPLLAPGGEWLVRLLVYHALLDGWAAALLGAQMRDAAKTVENGRGLPAREMVSDDSYEEWLRSVRHRAATDVDSKAAYWTRHLAEAVLPFKSPLRRPQPSGSTGWTTLRAEMSASFWDEVSSLTRKVNASPAMILAACIARASWSRVEPAAVIAIHTHGRDSSMSRRAMGCLSDGYLVHIRGDHAEAFEETIRVTRSAMLQGLVNRLPVSILWPWLWHRGYAADMTTLNSTIALNVHSYYANWDPQGIEGKDVSLTTAVVPSADNGWDGLTIDVLPDGKIRIQYSQQWYDHGQVSAWLSEVQRWLVEPERARCGDEPSNEGGLNAASLPRWGERKRARIPRVPNSRLDRELIGVVRGRFAGFGGTLSDDVLMLAQSPTAILELNRDWTAASPRGLDRWRRADQTGMPFLLLLAGCRTLGEISDLLENEELTKGRDPTFVATYHQARGTYIP